MMRIESLQNAGVKRLINLQQKARIRKEQQLFVVEGKREVERALQSGYMAEELWASQEGHFPEMMNAQTRKVLCTSQVFSKVAYRAEAATIVGVFKMKQQPLEDIILPENPLIVVLEAIEKPGNIGAVLRTSNALGVDAVFLCNAVVDVYNPNVIRNSLGGFFNVPIIQTSSDQAIAFFKEQGISIVTTYLEAAKNYLDADYNQPTALVFGSEAEGVSQQWVKSTNQNVIIPMQGVVDSLNISVAASIVMAEAKRQRRG